VTSRLHTSDVLQKGRARELLVNNGIASLQFYKAAASFVRRVVTSSASQLYECLKDQKEQDSSRAV
jgi:hypothetical protein